MKSGSANGSRAGRIAVSLTAGMVFLIFWSLAGQAGAAPPRPASRALAAPSAQPTPSGRPTSAPAAVPAATVGQGSVAAAAQPPSTANQHYDLKLRQLEAQVSGLKDRIFRTKTRLLLLKERILDDVIAEAKLNVLHINNMGSSFKPIQVYYRLDGEDLKLLDDRTGLLDSSKPVEIYDGNVAPGNHSLSVKMIYRGNSALFSYMKNYIFKLKAHYTFYATKGKITTVRSIGYLKGNITYDLTDRPSIKFTVAQRAYTKAIEANAQSGSAKKGDR